MRVRFSVPDLDYKVRELDETNAREIDFLPRIGERVILCPDGEDRSRDFVVTNVFHHPDLNTVTVNLGLPAWEHTLARITSEQMVVEVVPSRARP